MPDFMPTNDDQFDHLINSDLGPAVNNAGNPLQLTPAQITAFNAAKTNWTVAYPVYLAAKPAFDAALASKDEARAAMEAAARVVNNTVQANPAVDAAAKTSAGLPVHKTTHTPATTPTTSPVLYKVDNTHLLQLLWFSDSATPGSKAKPHGVKMLEIRETILATGAPAPVDANAMPFLANETKMPHRNDLTAADIGKTAYYAARWVNSKGDLGPWSAITGYIVN